MAAGILLRIVNAGSRLASEPPGQPRTSVLARRAAQRVREAAATFRRDEAANGNGDTAIERSHRFTIVSGRVDRESVKGTFGLSLSWRNAARRERRAPADGPLAVMRVHLDLHVPRLGRDLSCHRAFFFGSVPEAIAQGRGAPASPVLEHEAEHRVIDLRHEHEREDDAAPPRVPLFAHNPVVEHEREPVPTREPAPVRTPLYGSISPAGEDATTTRDAERVVSAPPANHAFDAGVCGHRDATDGPDTSDPDAPLPEGWHPDPAGHAELRYWDGHRWTAHISTGGRLWLSPIDATRPRTQLPTD